MLKVMIGERGPAAERLLSAFLKDENGVLIVLNERRRNEVIDYLRPTAQELGALKERITTFEAARTDTFKQKLNRRRNLYLEEAELFMASLFQPHALVQAGFTTVELEVIE